MKINLRIKKESDKDQLNLSLLTESYFSI